MSKTYRPDVSGISLTVDGVLVPAGDCVWIMYAPCGCLAGVMTVSQDSLTQAAAEADYYDDAAAAYVKQHKALGFELKLRTFEEYRQTPTMMCAHDPQWGIPAKPTPEGHSWLIEGGRFAKKTARRHLFPEGDDAHSLCGRVQQNRYHRFEPKDFGATLDCTDCITQGTAALAEVRS